MIHSWSQKHLHRLADRAAIALATLSDESSLLDPKKVCAMAQIVTEAFSYPQFIERPQDREPKAAIAL
jgi:hypothetical protein